MNTNPGVSVVIPTAQPRFLRHCLAGLARQRDRRFEVVVVENGPPEAGVSADVAGLAAQVPARYTYQREAGLNRARNRGCRKTRHGLIALLDDDCIPDENWIGEIIDHHRRFPAAGVIGGRVRLRFLAEPPSWLTGEFLLNLCRVDWGTETRPLGEREFIVGANMSFNRSLFDRVGGFDEEFGLTGRKLPQLANDETLFNRRAERLGGAHILYAPGIIVHHQIPAERLQYEYHEQRRYGQGVSDIDLAIHENRDDPLSGQERFRQVVQHQQWHREELLEARRNLGERDSMIFRNKLVQSRIAYLCGAQDRVLHRFVPGSLDTALTADEVRPYRAGRGSAGRLAPTSTTDTLYDTLESMLYRERPRSLRAPQPFDCRILHARVAFLKGFRDQLRGVDEPPAVRQRIQDLERIDGS